MILMLTEGHRVTGNLELCSHSVVKLHVATQMFTMVEYVREMSVTKSCMTNMDHLIICKFAV